MNEAIGHLATSITKRVGLDHFLYLPEEQSGPLPLLVFLHGAGARV